MDLITILDRLPPPLVSDRLLGQAVAANITYLLGDLVEGRRLADRTMIEAEQHDGAGLPVYQWLASYAYANSRLFRGEFDDAASLLGERWHEKYVSLPRDKRKELLGELHERSTLNPIASVPRHIILASAFDGKALRHKSTQPRAPSRATLESDHLWIKYWYRIGQALCRKEPISLHFTHGYMSLYCLVVEGLEEPLRVLDRIPPTAPAVSLYVKYGMLGLYYLNEREFDRALTELRRADSYSRVSGNRFFDGIFLPAHAAAAVRVNGPKDPEVRRIGRRARAHATIAHSAFYDSLVDALYAVVAAEEHKAGRFNYLKARATRWPRGLVRIYRLDEASPRGKEARTTFPDQTPIDSLSPDHKDSHTRETFETSSAQRNRESWEKS